MKSSVSFVFLVICTVVLAAQQSQAKKGCQNYGHVCYGGHGKRSLGSGTAAAAEQQEYVVRPNTAVGILPPGIILPPNELTVNAAAMPEVSYEQYPREFLIKIMKSWFGHPRRPADRLSELDYPMSAETYNRENVNNLN